MRRTRIDDFGFSDAGRNERFGMIETLKEFIDGGKMQFVDVRRYYRRCRSQLLRIRTPGRNQMYTAKVADFQATQEFIKFVQEKAQ